jgi:hypothetical protein
MARHLENADSLLPGHRAHSIALDVPMTGRGICWADRSVCSPSTFSQAASSSHLIHCSSTIETSLLRHPAIHVVYDLGFSFFSFHSALRPTPDTLTTLNRTPGMSPLALPFRPNPARRTSSFSSTKLRQPSFGTVKNHVNISSIILIVCSFQSSQSASISVFSSSGVVRTESSNLLPVFNQLHPHTLPDSRIGLFGFNTDFLEHDALCVRGSAEGRGFIGRAEQALFVVQVGPAAVFARLHELTGGVETAGFAAVRHF